MRKIVLILVFATLLALPLISPACTCPEDPDLTLKEYVTTALNRSAAVFAARVIEITKNERDFSYTAKLKVTEIWKGENRTQVLFKVGYADSCAFNFEDGKEIFTIHRRTKRPVDNKISAAEVAAGTLSEANCGF